jgi:hypothetical protein
MDSHHGLSERSGLGGVLLGANFLAGSLSEAHYLFFLIPAAVTVAASRSLVAQLLVLGALLVAFHGGVSPVALQERLVVAQLLAFAGCALAVVVSSRRQLPDYLVEDDAGSPPHVVNEGHHQPAAVTKLVSPSGHDRRRSPL